MKPTISIIIPVYNRASLVIRTLDSIAAQTLQPDRIIVVDNNSSDGSYDAVKRWMDAYSGTARCTLLTERKPGAAAARNKGLREAGLGNSGFLRFRRHDAARLRETHHQFFR